MIDNFAARIAISKSNGIEGRKPVKVNEILAKELHRMNQKYRINVQNVSLSILDSVIMKRMMRMGSNTVCVSRVLTDLLDLTHTCEANTQIASVHFFYYFSHPRVECVFNWNTFIALIVLVSLIRHSSFHLRLKTHLEPEEQKGRCNCHAIVISRYSWRTTIFLSILELLSFIKQTSAAFFIVYFLDTFVYSISCLSRSPAICCFFVVGKIISVHSRIWAWSRTELQKLQLHFKESQEWKQREDTLRSISFGSSTCRLGSRCVS